MDFQPRKRLQRGDARSPRATVVGGSESERFAGLDLLRGIAALAILVLHLPWPTDIGVPLPRAYLAVDMFFVLSGFVIAHAYKDRLGSWPGFRQFVLARLIRLYPVYIAATLFAAGEMLSYPWVGTGSHPEITAANVMKSLSTAVLLLPTPPRWSVEPTTFFPLLFPAWSLFWELSVNLIYGACGVRLRSASVLAAIGFAGLLLAEWSYGAAGGTSWEGWWAGGARALFSFFAGVAIFHLRQRRRAPPVRALLLAGMALLAFVPRSFGGSTYDLACIVLLFPLIVWLGADGSMGDHVRRAGTFLGFLSYPLYLVQAPLLLLSVRVVRIVAAGAMLNMLIAAAIILMGSWIVARCFDAPVRTFLRERLVPRAPQPGAETAP